MAGLEDAPQELSEDEFAGVVKDLIDESFRHIDDRIRPKRENSWRRYYGKVDAKPQNGGNDIVVRSIQDSVGAIIPDLLDIFTSADMITEFLPSTTNPLEGMLCEKGGKAVISTFWTAGGWLATHDAVQEAVISGYGFYKTYIAETEHNKYGEEMLEGDDVIARSAEANIQPMWNINAPPEQQQADPNYNRFSVVELTRDKQICIEAVPASNMIWAYAPCLEESWFVGQVTEVRLGDLAAYGFTLEELKGISTDTQMASRIRTEEDAQQNYMASNSVKRARAENANTWAGTLVAYIEGYAKVDKDGDGIPEFYKVWVAGDNKHIMRSVPCAEDDMPYILVPAYRIPHTTYSESIADRTEEFQEAETRMLRAQLDLAELIAGPMILNALGGGIDADKIASWKSHKVIDCRSTEAVKWLIPPDVGGSLLQTAQELKMRREDRTGVSRVGSSLRPEDMADVQATVAQAMGNSSEKKINHLARLQAELALKPLMERLLKFVVKLGRVMVDQGGEMVEINTTQFDPNWKVRVKVGLGTGTRIERSAALQTIFSALKESCEKMGNDNPVTDITKVRDIIYDYGAMQPGINIDRYVKTSQESMQMAEQMAAQPPPPDPAMEKVKVQAAADQQKIQNQKELNQQKMQVTAQTTQMKTQADIQNAQVEAQADMEIQRQKLINDFMMGMAELEQKKELALIEMTTEAHLEKKDIEMRNRGNGKTSNQNLRKST